MAEFPTFNGSWPWPWIGSYCIPSCITRRPLPTYQISLKSKKLFVDRRTYKRTYVCTEGHLRPTLLGWLGGVDLITIHTLWQDHVWNKERRTETSCYSWMDCRWRVSGATWRTAIRRRRMCLSLPARSYGAARLNAREGEFSCKQSQKHIQHDWVMSRSTHN